MEMKDGSKPFLLKNIPDKNYNIIIEKNSYSLVNDYTLFDTQRSLKFNTHYTLVKNILVTSSESSLTIEKLDKDSLILSQNIKGFEAKDLHKYFYVRKDILLQNLENNKKDTLVATSVSGPRPKFSITKRHLKDLTRQKPLPLTERSMNYRFNGNIYINLQSNSISIELKDYEKSFINNIEKKYKELTKLSNWNLSSVKRFKIIKIPFAFESYYELSDEVESYGEVYHFYSTDFNSFLDNSPSREQLANSNSFFKKGVEEYQKNNLELAVDLFEKAYKVNPHNLDAYYNSASISFAIGKTEKACKILEYLKLEGQKTAENDYNSKCQK
ncbi:lipopolysaccharide assembly protein LapB [Chryseobacterium sp. ERMR1:04]|uniref:tetratricopeptide repeat protein n=1 Tax=Chryseobacterium sp. ERMR1:04 TaxID=1705393 RepID=UPI0006C83E32|nr:tetratricopeptide repeat protein [Chryseobacterium sp. ERMR1:04]KPH14575.1 hypothetical protein AMQ68_03655 [Chryseobacterium sp. ERMR1:04]